MHLVDEYDELRFVCHFDDFVAILGPIYPCRIGAMAGGRVHSIRSSVLPDTIRPGL